MDTSILRNTKKILGLDAADTSFDTDVILQINSAFSHLQSLGVGPAAGFGIVDEEAQWDEFLPTADPSMVNLVKTCVFLRVRLAFDPPQTSFGLDALKQQLREHEWRLNEMREQTAWVDPEPPPVVIDAGSAG